jgi:uncharacterized membrane protein
MMTLLIAGVVLWTVVHLFPAVAPGVRANLVIKLGEGPYKGLFALDILIALGLIVFGWKSASPTAIYVPPLYGSIVPTVLIVIAIFLFVASSMPNNFKRLVRHPQMTAVLFWSTGHLLTNGDSRSLMLFGGLGIWALLEIIFINRRDGSWDKPASVPALKGVITVVVAVVMAAILAHFHADLFGVAVVPA